MPNKKKKRQIIEELQIEVKQLRAALEESRKYADKLVDHIPYLPADIRNLREANFVFSLENENCNKEIKEAIETLEQAGVDMGCSRKRLALSDGIVALVRMLQSSIDNFKDAFKAADQFTLPDEFPGPYHVKHNMGLHDIYSKSGDVVAITRYKDFASFIVNTLNAVDNHLKDTDN